MTRKWTPSPSASRQIIEDITASNGINLSRDDEAPTQAGFIVPNLGITIVPLVYGDHHSWNLAYLAGDKRNVPVHRHHFGVEIHLGFNPTHGQTVLGTHRANVDEGYAMPVPPETDHGWINTGERNPSRAVYFRLAEVWRLGSLSGRGGADAAGRGVHHAGPVGIARLQPDGPPGTDDRPGRENGFVLADHADPAQRNQSRWRRWAGIVPDADQSERMEFSAG